MLLKLLTSPLFQTWTTDQAKSAQLTLPLNKLPCFGACIGVFSKQSCSNRACHILNKIQTELCPWIKGNSCDLTYDVYTGIKIYVVNSNLFIPQFHSFLSFFESESINLKIIFFVEEENCFEMTINFPSSNTRLSLLWKSNYFKKQRFSLSVLLTWGKYTGPKWP